MGGGFVEVVWVGGKGKGRSIEEQERSGLLSVDGFERAGLLGKSEMIARFCFGFRAQNLVRRLWWRKVDGERRENRKERERCFGCS